VAAAVLRPTGVAALDRHDSANTFFTRAQFFKQKWT
jgi:hypothetical protein